MHFCLKIFFPLTNSVDPDEMQHYVRVVLRYELSCTLVFCKRSFVKCLKIILYVILLLLLSILS